MWDEGQKGSNTVSQYNTKWNDKVTVMTGMTNDNIHINKR